MNLHNSWLYLGIHESSYQTINQILVQSVFCSGSQSFPLAWSLNINSLAVQLGSWKWSPVGRGDTFSKILFNSVSILNFSQLIPRNFTNWNWINNKPSDLPAESSGKIWKSSPNQPATWRSSSLPPSLGPVSTIRSINDFTEVGTVTTAAPEPLAWYFPITGEPSLKQTGNAPENRPKPQQEREIVFHVSSIFRFELCYFQGGYIYIYQISTEPQRIECGRPDTALGFPGKAMKITTNAFINISQICQTIDRTSVLKVLDFHQLMVKSLIYSWRQNMTKLVFLRFSPFFCSPKMVLLQLAQ